MIIKIEPTGCCEYRGLVQVRFCMYLDKGDYGYDIHHVQAYVVPEGGYIGKFNKFGRPISMGAYYAWRESLPKVWRNNPFHNHFICVEPETPDKVIMDIGEAFLHEAYIKWACEEKLDLINPSVELPTSSDKTKIKVKVHHLKITKLERRL